jgi:hyperosmotically inducible periplasmic protein
MKPTLTMSAVIAAALLGTAGLALAQDADVDRSHPKAYVKDSAITTKIKTKLAADHLPSLAKIHVDTDADGVVWLSGSTHTQEDADRAMQIARDTDGVRGVKSDIKVVPDK